MSDALPLPPRPEIEHYRKLAEQLQQACAAENSTAIYEWAVYLATELARGQGARFSPDTAKKTAQFWRKFQDGKKPASRCTIEDAQLFVARLHGFATWPQFTQHLEELSRNGSPIALFEAAADAIVKGDSATLSTLLNQNPSLVDARSMREHRSTLLHYVSANGVEDFRQKSPPNIVEIARLLLDAGADVNAESEAYGGHSTALGLTATSCHPEEAGVQIPLMELLIERGAIIDEPDSPGAVISCLRNGRGEAAGFLAGRGARLDLEGAAGVGRLDIVQSFFEDDGTLTSGATSQQFGNAFIWACEFGHTSIVEFFLAKGIDVATIFAVPHGQTGLHWAAYGAHADIVKTLLNHHPPVNVKDRTFSATPLGWALHAYKHAYKKGSSSKPRSAFHKVVALLVAAGANVEPFWMEDIDIRTDPQMLKSLSGKEPDNAS